MYRLEAKLVKKGRIVGYLLKTEKGTMQVIPKESIASIVHEIDRGYVNSKGYLALKGVKMSAVPNKSLKELKRLKQELSSRYTEIKVTSKETLRTTASKGDQSKWVVGTSWVKEDSQGYEGLAEEFVSLFLSCVEGIDYVLYYSCYIVKETGERSVGCYSKSMFQNPDEIFITFHKLYEQRGLVYENTLKGKSTVDMIKGTIEFIKEGYGIDVTEYLIKTLYIDRLILNEDRHPSNLGLIKDIRTNKYRVAPIFDNGLAFLARESAWGNVPIHVAERNLKFEPFGNKQIKALAKISSKKLVIDTRKVKDLVRGYDNPLYRPELVQRVKDLLLKNLATEEGKLWVQK